MFVLNAEKADCITVKKSSRHDGIKETRLCIWYAVNQQIASAATKQMEAKCKGTPTPTTHIQANLANLDIGYRTHLIKSK